ncbi:MAG: response regulator [Oscillatoriaceae bacterium SKW80]|nr:response regulator [Oscillatoriaceae bacterium SKYG93]MCX8119684.1 response regulator [Oscillatoriaceae bacterium SKW80]MDW8452439.1 response regulator [Oscillatoriaceae cyanobacterium SKYGB_i_bin93]HIK27587.1 response regulator [Oscillatoriaceae cyanobacterium M7585_C2015_266]
MKSKNLAKKSILIIDDSPTNLELISELFNDSEFEVCIAPDGEVGIKKAEVERPDLILLDVIMPGIDGFETCKMLKKNPATKDIPVIFMTARSETVDKVKGLTIGAVDYITKPFQQEEVLARLRLHLRLYSLTRTLEEQNLILTEEIEKRAIAEAALRDFARELEKRVEERTAELTRALHDLQAAQLQLVQSEKMSILGQLVASVAHEINNPVNFVSGNISHAQQYINQLIEHLQLYQQYCQEKIPNIEEHARHIDLEYLIKDLPKIISSMKIGIERIRSLSVSLRNFYRADSLQKLAFNIHEGIDSTLLILGHRLKANNERPAIEVILKYGKLPLVKCYPGQLNQVFMNLIANAIDAIEEKDWKSVSIPTIRISTEVIKEDWVAIRIVDNGCGMTPEVKQRLFEPLFTTKPRGKGTGLGLSISRQIVEEKHGGRLTCISEEGEGSEFVIELPINSPSE